MDTEQPSAKDVELTGTTFILSDVHLRRGDERKTLLLEFIEEKGRKGNIILVGDIFDVWIGANADMQREFSDIVSSLERMRNRVIYVEGNHDFHLTWLDEIGVRRFTEAEITINGLRFFVSHGDLYSGEISHRIYRKMLLKTEKMFRLIANGHFERSINRIGQIISAISHRRYMNPKASRARNRIFSSMLANAMKIATLKDLNGTIFGHCHIPTIMKAKVGRKLYLNAGFWSTNEGTYIEIDGNGKIELRTWKR